MQITPPFFAPYRQKKEDFFMSEKKVGKRLLTWVLVLVMTLSLLPLNVLAEDSGEDSVVYGHYVGNEWVKDGTGTNNNNGIELSLIHISEPTRPY